jgi:hypothetical protein
MKPAITFEQLCEFAVMERAERKTAIADYPPSLAPAVFWVQAHPGITMQQIMGRAILEAQRSTSTPEQRAAWFDLCAAFARGEG